MLNYKTEVNLEMSLKKIIEFIKKNGPKKFEYNYELEIINEKNFYKKYLKNYKYKLIPRY